MRETLQNVGLSHNIRGIYSVAIAVSLFLALFLMAAQPSRAQASCANVVPDCTQEPVLTVPPIDNRDGYLVGLEEAVVKPLELIGETDELWAVNVADASIEVFDTSNPTALSPKATVKVGLGPVSIRYRPGSREIWVVCQSSNSVFILSVSRKLVLDSLRLAHEPSGLVFDAAGDNAFVTLSASNQIQQIDTATRTVVATYDFASPFPTATSPAIHAEEPRALLVSGNDLYVLSFESGNGTTPGVGAAVGGAPIEDRWQLYDPTVNPIVPPPPDRDVFRFNIGSSGSGEVALWRMGSMNFDLAADPTGRLWVSNIDYNNTLVGEFNFPGAGIARHRLTHGLPLAANQNPPTQPPTAIDLNTAVDNTLQAAGYACSMPTEMAPTADFGTIYVACYETHNVAVVDTAAGIVTAELRGLSKNPLGNVGVRGVALDEGSGVLYAYSRDGRIQVYTVPVATGSVNAPVQTLEIGFDITSALVEEGRFHNINALRASNRAQSCNTCHIDGHLDRIGWDLSDFTGNLDISGEEQPRRPKNTKVTMSLRGIEETPPLHWRGDRANLEAFNPAFEGLLGGKQLTKREMAAYKAFVFSLSYPANPKQSLDRSYTQQALDGFTGFQCAPSHAIRFDRDPNGARPAVTCGLCHDMAASSGTNNQVNSDASAPLPDDATQLRGLFDKDTDVVDYTAFPSMLSPRNFMPATGWGFANTGFVDCLGATTSGLTGCTENLLQPSASVFIGETFFPCLQPQEVIDIVRFVEELDTGVAPAAAFAWTLNAASAGTLNQPFDTLLKAQAENGHIDLIARGWIKISGTLTNIGMLYDVASGKFVTDTNGIGPFSYADLKSQAAAVQGSFTLIGTPVGMGYRLALDEEMDYLFDGNETASGAVVGLADTDGDGAPDGYEVRLGSDPNNPLDLPPADNQPPQILNPRISWTNSNVAKVRWETDEESISRVAVFPAGQTTGRVFFGEERQFKTRHVMVAQGLDPGEDYDVEITAVDPGNLGPGGVTATATIPGVQQQDFLFESLHVEVTKLDAAPQPSNCPLSGVELTATFKVIDEKGVAVPDATVRFRHLEWIPGQAGSNFPPPGTPFVASDPSDSQGVAQKTFCSHYSIGSGAVAEVWVKGNGSGVDDDPANGFRIHMHPLDGQFGFWAQVPLP